MSETPSQPGSSSHDLVADLLAQYLDLRNAGERPDLETFLERCPPEKRAALREAIQLMSESGTPHLRPPGRVGDFEIVREIGRGGMGVVYEARQISLNRKVALKLLAPWVAQLQSAKDRFLREAQSVGRLQHPNLVTVHAVGEEEGHAYLAMELVPGRGLDEILAEAKRKGERVPIPQLLRWIAGVARGLEAAHAQGIIHRDVKPSNIRITPDDRALLLDFGLARDAQAMTMTKTGEFAGSPYYCSPEQVAAKRMGIDERTDIYSLGVTLYEAVTGVIPFEGDTTEQIFSQILVKEPPHPRRINPSIASDLETTILCAMEKSRERRYATARDLAEDLEALLAIRPIKAKPAGPMLRLRRWSRRNPALAASLLGTAALLVLGLGLTSYFLKETSGLLEKESLASRRAEKAEKEAVDRLAEAQKQAKRYSAINQFLQDMFLSASPDQMGKDIRVVDVLEQAGDRIDSTFPNDLDARWTLHWAIGHSLRNLGFYQEAEKHIEAALDASLQLFGSNDPNTSDIILSRAHLLFNMGQYGEAEQVYRDLIGCFRSSFDELSGMAWQLQGRIGLCLINQRKFEEGEVLIRESLEGLKKVKPEGDPIILDTSNSLVTSLVYRGDYASAQLLAKETYYLFKDYLGETDPDVLVALHNYASILYSLGQSKEALSFAQRVLSLREAVLGPSHNYTLVSAHSLAIILSSLGKSSDAEPLFREVITGWSNTYGETHPDTLSATINFAASLINLGRDGEAEEWLKRILELSNNVVGSREDLHFSACYYLSISLISQRKLEEAERLLLLTIEKCKRVSNGAQFLRLLYSNLGGVYQDQKEYEKSLECDRQAWRSAVNIFGEANLEALRYESIFANSLQKNGSLAEAETRWSHVKKTLEETGEADRDLQSRFKVGYGDFLARSGRFEEAELLLLTGYRDRLEYDGPESEVIRKTIEKIVDLYEQWGKPEKAAEFRRLLRR